MVIESRACPSCEDSVPPGRLSCPHCGAVLAAVAHRVDGGAAMEPRRPLAPIAPPEPPAVADDGWDADPDVSLTCAARGRRPQRAHGTATEHAAAIDSPLPPGPADPDVPAPTSHRPLSPNHLLPRSRRNRRRLP